MAIGKSKARQTIYKNVLEHPYKKYEPHPFWKRIDKGISDLVKNQDLIEKEARPYIVGYLCKMLLSGRKKAK
jgi:hypothetical protein